MPSCMQQQELEKETEGWFGIREKKSSFCAVDDEDIVKIGHRQRERAERLRGGPQCSK